MRTILFDLEGYGYEDIRPDQVASTIKHKNPLWFFAIDGMIVIACASWEYSAEQILGRFNTQRTTAKSRGHIDLVPKNSVKASGYLIEIDGQLQVIEWLEIQYVGFVSKAFLDECMIALGATKESENARKYHAYRH